jgi:uncharacterized protein YhjY with autotransporter beta-barrel domain
VTPIVRAVGWSLLASAPFWCTSAGAQSLLDMVNTLTADGVFQFDALERAAAIANDNAYVKVRNLCGIGPQSAVPTCTGNTLTLFNRLRELEDNANELLGNRGETQFSLHLDPLDISDALRWTAPEEYAAQGSMASKFVNSQASVLTNRFAALRFASHGINLAQNGDGSWNSDGFSYAYNGSARGGGASADSSDSFFSRLSIFVNGGFGSGDKDPTTFEDAFFFDSTEISAGADLRLTNRIVVGLLIGHTEKRIDFNAAKSIVDGGIRGNGQSVMAYMQYETDSAFVNVAIGAQHLSLATRRRITYPSNNPDVAPVDVTSYSNTGSTAFIATLGAGYSFHWRGLSAEPYLNLQNVSTKISAFTEHSDDGFDIATPSQTIQSLEGSVGVRAQYAILNRFGVIVPYVYAEARRQFRDNSRNIASGYTGDGGATDFNLPTDDPVKHYYVVGGGGSVVLTHGLQGFLQYVRVLDYTHYTDHTVSGGIRWEF